MRALLAALVLLFAPALAFAQDINNPPAPTTGTGSWVRATTPTLVTPVLGVATGTSVALGGCSLSGDVFCATGTATFSSNVFGTDFRAANNVRLGQQGSLFYWSTSTEIVSPANGVVRWRTTAGGQLTVSTLPACTLALTGMRAFVTDALTPVFGSAVAAGGAVHVPVYCDGGTTSWKVG